MTLRRKDLRAIRAKFSFAEVFVRKHFFPLLILLNLLMAFGVAALMTHFQKSLLAPTPGVSETVSPSPVPCPALQPSPVPNEGES